MRSTAEFGIRSSAGETSKTLLIVFDLIPRDPLVDNTESTMETKTPKTESGSTKDSGAVKLGGHSPSLPPAPVRDTGRVKLGGHSPSL